MKFGIIDAKRRTAAIGDYRDMEDAQRAAGLDPGAVDFGALSKHVHIVVWEYGLFAPTNAIHYFSVVGKLYAGNAVIFAADDSGRTIDLPMLPPVVFFQNADAVEKAIERGELQRPQMAVNGAVLWQWPDPTT